MIDMFGDDAIASGSVLCAHLRLGDFAEGPTSALRLLATLALRIRKTAASRNSTALLFLTDGDGADAEFLMAIAGITPSFHGCVSNGRPCSVPTSIGEEQLSNFIAVREQAMCAHAGTFLGSITYSTFSGLIRDLHADVGGLTTDVFDIHVPPLGGLPVFDILDAKIVTLGAGYYCAVYCAVSVSVDSRILSVLPCPLSRAYVAVLSGIRLHACTLTETFYPSEPVAPLVSFSAALSPLGAFHVENSTDWTVFPPSANGSTPVDPLGSGAYSTLGFNRLCVDTNSSFVLLSSRSPSTSLSRDSFILEAGGWWRVLPIEEVVEHAVWPPVVPLFLPSCGLVDVVPKLFGVLSSLTSRGLPLPSLVLASTVTVCESSAMRAVLTEFHITCSVPESLLTNLPYACFANSTLQTCEPPLLQSHNHSVAFANLVRKHLGVTLSRPVSRTIHIMDLETQFDDVGGIRDFLNRSSGGLPLLPPLPQSASEGDLVSRLSNTGVTIALCPSLLSHAPFLSPGSVLLLLVTNGCSETVARAAVMAGATVVTYPLLDGVEVRNTSRVRLSLPRFASVYGPVIAKFFCDTETNLDLRRGCA